MLYVRLDRKRALISSFFMSVGLVRGALKIKKIQKVQTLADPPLPPPSPLHGSVKPIFFSYRRSTPPLLTKFSHYYFFHIGY